VKFFVFLVLAFLSAFNICFAAEFDKYNQSTWNEGHQFAARFEYCTVVIESICPQNMGRLGNPFAEKKHECPFFTDKLKLAKTLLLEQSSEKQRDEYTQIRLALAEEIRRARLMDQLEVPTTAYDNCQNEVGEFLKKYYKPLFNLETFNN
jgi:hypothetical protein